MDPDSPITRMERTFWSVWYYITGAVNRIFRPELTDLVSNDPNCLQEPAVDCEPANCGLTEGGTCRGEVDEEQSLAVISLLSSPQSVVAWELCTTDIDLGPDEESMRYKTQLSRGSESKASEEGEGEREKPFTPTGSDDASFLIATDATKKEEQEENKDWKLDTPGRDGYERHTNTVSLNIAVDAVSDVEESERKAGAEEETDGAMTPQDQQKMDETMTNNQTEEEDSEMQREVEQDSKYSYSACSVEAEETEIQLCTLTDLSQEEEDDTHVEEVEEAGVQRSEAVTPEEVENSDGALQLASENENRHAENLYSVFEDSSDVDRDSEGDPSIVSSDTASMAYEKSGIVSVDDQIVVGQEQMMLDISEGIAFNKVEDQKEEEKEDENAMDDEEHVIEEENVNELAGTSNNQTTDDVPEDSQEEDIINVRVACSEDFTHNATTELHKAEFTDREQEDVAKDPEVQTKGATDDAGTKSRGSVMNINSDVGQNKAEAEEGRLSGEDGDNDGCIDIACVTTTVTVKPDSETGQEMSGEFKNIPLGICEGRAVVYQELNSTTREETQEGVPEYNNEPGPNENTTQRLLEGGDDEEIQTTQLPEEVENEEPASLQNSGSSSGAHYLLVRDRMEEEQDLRLTTTEESENSFDEEGGILSVTDAQEPLAEPVIQGSGHLFVKEEGQLSDSSMKTGILKKEFETHVGSADDEMTEEPEDGTEALLVEFEVDEGLCDSGEADAAGSCHETTGAAEDVAELPDAEAQTMSFYDGSVNSTNSTSRTFGLPGDVTESGFLRWSVEPKLPEDCAAAMQEATIEMQDAGIDMEETSYGFEEEVAEVELTTDKKENALIARSESSTCIKAEPQFQTLQTEVQLSDEALEEMLTDTETAEEPMTTELGPRHSTTMSTEEMAKHESEGSYAEESVSSISGCPDVLNEEILDLWIQAALSVETVGTEQQEMQLEKDKEQLVESNSPESGLVSDTEISSSTAESEGCLDQSLGEWGTQNSESQLLKSASTESLKGIDSCLASMSESADVSELSMKQPASEPQGLLIEVTAEAGQEESFTVTDQESDETEEGVESVETGVASQRETDAEVTDWKDPEDVDVKSLTEMSSLFAVEQTNIQDEPLEINMSDSQNDISSGQSRRDSEASLEEGIVLTDSGSPVVEICFESEKKSPKLPSLDKTQALWSEEIAESPSGLNGAEVTEPPKSEDQMEVNASVLDFTAQRSRIAVKNPHVRPPKDPRSLLHMPSVEPTPATRLPVKVPAGVPAGGLGIGIKLPGLGAGFPVLKKTQRVVKDKNNHETSSQESETKPEETDGTPKQDEAQQKPKWMPPRHPGFGNPLMSELKTKLKKTTKE